MWFGLLAAAVGAVPTLVCAETDRCDWRGSVRALAAGNRLLQGGIVAALLAFGWYGTWLYGWSREYAGFLLLVSYLTAVTVTDIRSRQIPDRATAVFAIAFVLFQLSSLDAAAMLNALIGALAGGMLPYIAYRINSNAIGFGDVKMLACVGLIAGFPSVIYIIVRALAVCLVYALVMMALKRAGLKSELPFAPFLLAGAVV